MHPSRIQTFLIAIFVAAVCSLAPVSTAAPSGTKFKTPEKAVDAFIAAVRAHDVKKLEKMFGTDSQRLFESGDPVFDKNLRADFLAYYDATHQLAERADGARVLVVGAKAWPFPIPLVKTGSKWQFDTPAGLDEIINRRIGRNELSAIQTCLAIGDAQREYFQADHDGDGIREYAQKVASTPGSQDGLFWRVAENEPPSPLGELIAAAVAEGYTKESPSYNGYRYRLLSAQGPAAPGGAYDYVVRGYQIGGFAVLAVPAIYGDSGIMTFMVSHSGIVYQRDLGEKTAEEALKITTFDPGEGWAKVSDEDLKTIPED